MRQLTEPLLNAQKSAGRMPCIKVQAVNKNGGVIRQDWTRYYTGAEPDNCHALAIPGDGSLIRARLTPPADSRKVYYQRVANPGPESDFSPWTYTGQYDAQVIALASLGAEISLMWVKSNREIRRMKSTDNGTTWGSPELIDYTPTTSVYGIAAAYKPNGDLAVFFADLSTLYVKKCLGGQWQTKISWNKTTGNLSGVACVYDNDWTLMVTGKDTAGNYKVWSFVYGDGGDVTAGAWSALKEMASAPAAGDFSYKQPFLDKTDTFRCVFVEKYAGIEAYSRPFCSYVTPGTHFVDGLWCEPAPLILSSEYGLAVTHNEDYGWLSSPGGVWRAPIYPLTLDLSGDVTRVRQETGKTTGLLTVELMNDDNRYAFPGQGDLALLRIGNRLEFSPGYVTLAGAAFSDGQSYTIDSLEHVTAGGRAGLVIRARDGWGVLSDWRARQQFRWNKNNDELNVRDIVAAILARAGIKLTVISQSAAITGFYPDFTVNPDNNGKDIIQKLLSFVPDRLLIEGDTTYLVNPQVADGAVYSYGADHSIIESSYLRAGVAVNHAQVEGWDTGAGKVIIVDSFAPGETARPFDRIKHVTDRNLSTVIEAGQRGAAILRQAEIEADESVIMIPVNCGQQLYDVVAVTDIPAGLSAVSMRVTGMALVYNPDRGEYLQRLSLGRA